jgi:hypothetical protein
VRGMSPEEFVQYLARDLRAIGVVAGCNYRFGAQRRVACRTWVQWTSHHVTSGRGHQPMAASLCVALPASACPLHPWRAGRLRGDHLRPALL